MGDGQSTLDAPWRSTPLWQGAILAVLLIALPALGEARELSVSRSVTLNAANPSIKSPTVNLDPLTSAITVKLQRPTTAQPLSWTAAGRLRVMIVLIVDGVEYPCIGTTSGGIRLGKDGVELNEYVLTYKPTVLFGQKSLDYLATAQKDGEGFYNDVPLMRIGETGTTVQGYLLLERISGTINTTVTVAATTEGPAPTIRHKNSIAFDAATDAQEVSGDGVISLTHTSSGSDRAWFCGSGAWTGGLGTSCTYNGVGGTELWDINGNPYWNAGYYGVGQATGAQTVTFTMASAGSHHAIGVISLTGVDQTTPVGTPATANGVTGTISVTVGSVGATDYLIDNAFSEDPTPPTVGADQTLRNSEIMSSDTALLQSTQSGASGGVMSWSGAALTWYTGAVAFKEAAGGGPTCRGALMLMGVGGC